MITSDKNENKRDKFAPTWFLFLFWPNRCDKLYVDLEFK